MTLRDSKLPAKRRSYLDVIYDILSIAVNGVKKTQIMYGANLSYSQLISYLNFTLSSGLLSAMKGDGNEELYLTTEKGLRFLREYEKLRELLEP